MDVIVVFVALSIFYFLLLFAVLRAMMIRESLSKLFSDMFKPYDGPAGEPRWYGTLPQKVDDYVCPRYIYENLVESTEFLPENGRIILSHQPDFSHP